ncbi:MAG TPA: UbiX family flavin prenyltransferase [Pseudonocardiaceae bacterium]|nr:UbiX family flavin prenyltransferase [Pseudonocardiaceae bacterium]
MATTDGRPRRVVLAITGASGAAIGLRILALLRDADGVESHLVVSRAGAVTLRHECDASLADVRDMADAYYRTGDIGAAIASGSFPVDAMIVAPCSIKTLSAIAYTYTDDLVSRAADVTLKEGRPLLLMVRETPLHLGHLRSMVAATEAGAIIAPPVPAFYPRPQSIDDMIDYSARRALARVGLCDLAPAAWQGELNGRGDHTDG